MKKIAFFFSQPYIQEKDLSDLMSKSYKLGGSEFEFLVVSYLIEQNNNGIDSFLLSNYDGKVPHLKFNYVENVDKLVNFALTIP